MISGPPAANDLARRLRLIVITDRALAGSRNVADIVGAALWAGAPAVQLREKSLPPRETLRLARRLRADTRAAGSLFFVNDRVDLALAVAADGVHLGPGDLPVSAARRITPPDFLIGYSADDAVAARAAVADGANYIGCGTVFPTRTKPDAGNTIGLDGLAAVVSGAGAPVVGIGGITAPRARRAFGTGAVGCAVVSAVMAHPDPARAVEELLRASSEARE